MTQNLKLNTQDFALHPPKGLGSLWTPPYLGTLSPDPCHRQTPGGTAGQPKAPRTPRGKTYAVDAQCIPSLINVHNVTNITHSTYNRIYVLFRPLLKNRKKK